MDRVVLFVGMDDTRSAESPLDAATDTVGHRAIEAFSVLGNETRLSILLALWEAYVPFGDANAVSFSKLRERLGRPDSGQFNYHLGKLEGYFVRKTDAGYHLTEAGHNIVQTVIAGTGIHTPSFDSEEVEKSCFRCGAPVEVTYEGEVTKVGCTECEGWWDWWDFDGALVHFGFPPAGLEDRTPAEVLHATFAYQLHRAEMMMDGVCPTCGGRVRTALDICDDHESTDGTCDACGTPFLGVVHWRCLTCKNAISGPSWAPLLTHPAVIGFYYEHGIELAHSTWAGLDRGNAWQEELFSEDPPKLRFSVTLEGNQLSATVDETGAVVAVDR